MFLSIGLVTSCSDAFVRMFPKSLSYRTWACIFTVFSFVVSNFGLSKIIEYSLPVLMFLYPLAITLILLALTGKIFDHDRVVYVSVTVFTSFSALFDLFKTLPEGVRGSFYLDGAVAVAQKILPWFEVNLGWVLPALIGFAVGMLIRTVKKEC